MMHFLPPCRKFLFGTPVDYSGFSTQTECRTGCIHSHIPAPDHYCLVSGIDRSHIVIAVGFHEVVPGKELIRREYSVQILSGDTHETRQSRTRAYEYSGIPFFIKKRIYRNGPAYNHICLNPDTEGLDCSDFGCDHLFFRKPEFGNPVFKYATGLMESLEYGDFISHLCQVAGTRQT